MEGQKQSTRSLAGGGLKAMYTFNGWGRVKGNVHILEESDVHIHWLGEGLKAMYTFWRKVMYTFIGRGKG